MSSFLPSSKSGLFVLILFMLVTIFVLRTFLLMVFDSPGNAPDIINSIAIGCAMIAILWWVRMANKDDGRIACPECAERIKPEAKKCPFCKSDIPSLHQ